MNVANQAYGALNELYVLLAKADLGALRSPSSFDDEVGSYAGIIGGFQVGRLMAAGRPVGGFLHDLDKAIGQCADQVRRMSDVHRSAGLAPGSTTLRSVRTSCDTAARSVAAEEASSWIFSTAAGDL
jgi:hypothetical protein